MALCTELLAVRHILGKLITAHLIQKFPAFYEGWNFNSGNYLFTTDTK